MCAPCARAPLVRLATRPRTCQAQRTVLGVPGLYLGCAWHRVRGYPVNAPVQRFPACGLAASSAGVHHSIPVESQAAGNRCRYLGIPDLVASGLLPPNHAHGETTRRMSLAAALLGMHGQFFSCVSPWLFRERVTVKVQRGARFLCPSGCLERATHQPRHPHSLVEGRERGSKRCGRRCARPQPPTNPTN